MPDNPLWYGNLIANPDEATLQDGPSRSPSTCVRSRVRSAAAWWSRAVEAYPPYAEYQEKAGADHPGRRRSAGARRMSTDHLPPRHLGARWMGGGEHALRLRATDRRHERQDGEDPTGAVELDELWVDRNVLHAAVGRRPERDERVEGDPHGVSAGVGDGGAHCTPSRVVDEDGRVAVGHHDEQIVRHTGDRRAECLGAVRLDDRHRRRRRATSIAPSSRRWESLVGGMHAASQARDSTSSRSIGGRRLDPDPHGDLGRSRRQRRVTREPCSSAAPLLGRSNWRPAPRSTW